MRKVALFLALSLMGCTAQQATTAQDDACWIQAAANAAGQLESSNPDVVIAASMLSAVSGYECKTPVPAQVVK